MASAMGSAQKSDSGAHDNKESHKPLSKFRFKDGSKRKVEDRQRSRDQGSSRHSGRHSHLESKRRKTKHSSSRSRSQDDPAIYDDNHLPNITSDQYTDPERAFRESLFDAMADDEGAHFWEGVYGQPIHIYPNSKPGTDGALEHMTDEEYAAYVRSKMYEKTHQHLMEEKARRDMARQERERLAKDGIKTERQANNLRKKVEESLKRGVERRNQKAWAQKWDAYISKWEILGHGGAGTITMASIPWPVESGRRQDIVPDEVERFFLYGPTSGQPTETQLGKVLKLERVRWHPDKIQQKLGGQDVSEDFLQAVTSVFQIIDKQWSEIRDSKS